MEIETQSGNESVFRLVIAAIVQAVGAIGRFFSSPSQTFECCVKEELKKTESTSLDDLNDRIERIERKSATNGQQLPSVYQRLKESYSTLTGIHNDTFTQFVTKLHVVNSAYQESFARQVEEVLRPFLGADFGSFDANRNAAHQIQALLKRFGYHVKEPNTAKPANLVYKRIGNSAGRFVFEYRVDGEKRTGATDRYLPAIEVTPDADDQLYVKYFHDMYSPNSVTPNEIGENLDVAA